MRKIIRCSNVGKDARYNKVTVEQEKEALKKLVKGNGAIWNKKKL